MRLGNGAIGNSAIGGNAGDTRSAITLRSDRSEFYRLRLTGSADSLDDVAIPMSSCTVRLRSDTPTYVSAVVPGIDYAADIAARPNGSLILTYVARYLDGSEDALDFAEALLEDVRLDIGANNQSITLTGHKQITNSEPKTHAVTVATYQSSTNGKITLRAAWDPNIKAGDTVQYGAVSFVVGSVVLYVSASSTFTELQE